MTTVANFLVALKAIEQAHILKFDPDHTPLLTVLSRNPITAEFVLILTIFHARCQLIFSLVNIFDGIDLDLDISRRAAIVYGASKELVYAASGQSLKVCNRAALAWCAS